MRTMSEPHSRQPREGGALVRSSRDADDGLMDTIKGWLRQLRRSRGSETVRGAIEELLEDRDEAGIPIDEHERLLLSNILRLRERTAHDVMVPSADVVGVEASTGATELIDLFVRCGHSRLPVYREKLDDIIGMVHVKDVLASTRSGKTFQLARMVRRVLFIAPSMQVMDLLLEMRVKRIHMALVVDEYGGIGGIVTAEDLLEQIVGDIEDEHDHVVEPDLVLREDGIIEADARTPIDDFEAMVGLVLTEAEREDVDTVGGLVFLVAGRVPACGEIVAHPSGLAFEVVDADPRRVKWVRVRKTSVASPEAEPE